LEAAVILRGARVALGPEEAAVLDIEMSGGKIQSMRKLGKPARGADVLDLGGRLILPGLINAHDHLEFNLYPRLGHGPYPNAGAWARDIYRPKESPISEHLRVPKSTRLLWGGLKNLLSGVTTVCHHNPREEPVLDRNFPVRVLKQFGWAHSLEFSNDVAMRFELTPAEWPFILHLGEGSDSKAKREIFDLDEMGALDQRTVLTHAVALDRRGLRLAKERGASLIWGPSSNLFLLGRTLSKQTLRSGVRIALGSDSALTARGDLLDEIQVARRISRLPSAVIYRMVTEEATRILRLRGGAGSLVPGGVADLIAIPDNGRSPSEALMRTTGPQLVMIGGRVKLIATELARNTSGLQRLNVDGRGDFLVRAPVARLRKQAERALGTGIRLAGRKVLA
jgi:cytosine/adenosine deaminase-related metal-dependent hydrolase